jgi:glycosyltransferase involved in cell wall biosynthesis
MLTQNDWRHDSRVVREAEAIESAGNDVTVVCRDEATRLEEVGGVRYVTVERPESPTPRSLPTLFAAHIRVLFADVAGTARGPERLQRVLSGFEAAALLILSVPAAAVGAVVFVAVRTGAYSLVRRSENARRAARPLRRVVAGAMQPWVYLNEYAGATKTQLRDVDPAVVHAHDLVTLSAGAALSRSTGALLLYDAHELETQTNYWGLNALTRRELRRYERALTPGTAAVVTVCDSIADWLAREYRLPRPVVVLNAPNPASAATPGDVRQTLALPESVPLAVYVGSVTIDRGLENCVRALVHAPLLHLATVGPRTSEMEQTLVALAHDLGVTERFHLVDPVAPDRVTHFIASATCSVIAIQNVCLSYAYCLPNKLLESVFAGLPVAVSDLPEMRRFVEAVGCGVVMDERDPVAIAQALTNLCEEPERYRIRGERLVQFADEFGWPAQRARLLDLYTNLQTSAG